MYTPEEINEEINTSSTIVLTCLDDDVFLIQS